MNLTLTEKKFDCLAYKREVQLKIYEKIKDMTAAEEMAYFGSPYKPMEVLKSGKVS